MPGKVKGADFTSTKPNSAPPPNNTQDPMTAMYADVNAMKAKVSTAVPMGSPSVTDEIEGYNLIGTMAMSGQHYQIAEEVMNPAPFP